jgi:hypothetical protein
MGLINNPPLIHPSGIALSQYVAEKTFAVTFPLSQPNQKVRFFWPSSTRLQGRVEVTAVTGYYGANCCGYIKRIYSVWLGETGANNLQVNNSEAAGYMNGTYTLSDFAYDGASSRWAVTLATIQAEGGNDIGVTIQTWSTPTAAPPWTNMAATNVVMGPVITSDVSAVPAIVTGHTINGGVH